MKRTLNVVGSLTLLCALAIGFGWFTAEAVGNHALAARDIVIALGCAFSTYPPAQMLRDLTLDWVP